MVYTNSKGYDAKPRKKAAATSDSMTREEREAYIAKALSKNRSRRLVKAGFKPEAK